MESPKLMDYVEMDPSSRYGRFGEILGKGAMKTVYRAFDEVLGIEVAWNQVVLTDIFHCPDDLQRLYTEVNLLKNLRNDTIIQFYTSWIDKNQRTFNFITELFSSGTLRDYRQKYKRVHMGAIKNWARQILHGLIYLHSHDPPVIHRDIKCDNIFVNGHIGQVKIGDLGLAAVLRGSQNAHSVIGTPEFMAPELYEEDYNELVDVYSFGMCVLEMLTSEYPYGECSNTAQIYKKVTSGKKPNAFYKIQDAEAQQFVGKCLEVAAKRLPAHQLLLDPFLASQEANFSISLPPFQIYPPQEGEIVRSTSMIITGTVNRETNTVFLKVQIVSSDGGVRNVHFPFDIVHDTPPAVAIEMVKELDITEWEPFDIANMIEDEISALVPNWKDLHRSPRVFHTREFSYVEGDDDGNNNNVGYDNSSMPNASKDETISSSTCSNPPSHTMVEKDESGEFLSFQGCLQSTGLFSQKKTSKEKRNSESKMKKVKSFFDLRSQLLHKAVMQAMNKKRSVKTV